MPIRTRQAKGETSFAFVIPEHKINIGVDARVGYPFGTRNRPWRLSLIATNLFDDRHLEYPIGSPAQAGRQRRTVYLALKGGF